MDPQIASDPMISSTCIPRTLTASHVSPAPQQVDESTVRLRLVRNDDAPQLALEIGGQVVGLRRRSTVLGTGAVDLPIRDNFVSTRHARILKESGGYVVEDLDSKNGTHVDGVRVPAGGMVALEPGGYHVMFMGLRGKPFKIGDMIPVTLVFEHAGDVDIMLEVVARTITPDENAPMDHGEMDHSND